MQRVITGVVLAVGMAALVFLASPDAFRWAVVAISVLAAVELVRISGRLAPSPAHWLLLLLVPLMTGWQWGWIQLGERPGFVVLATFGALTGLVSLLASRGGVPSRDPQKAPLVAGLLAFGTAYLSGATVAMGELHTLDPWLFFLLVVIVAASDTAAYYGGKATGRHKLAPAVSPNKTIEGSLWGLLAAVICVAIYCVVRLDRLDPGVLLAGGLTAMAGQLGDLIESLFKRAAGIKDSGNILPGHGGILDRIDALLLAAPVLFLAVLVLGPDTFVP